MQEGLRPRVLCGLQVRARKEARRLSKQLKPSDRGRGGGGTLSSCPHSAALGALVRRSQEMR